MLYAGYELMDGLLEYVTRIVAAALLCGIIVSLTKRSSSGNIVRMLCGVFMTIVLIQPIAGANVSVWESILPDITGDAEAVASEGAAAAEDIRREYIKQRVQAYILSRAKTMEADIQANVSLDEDCIPVSVSIAGRISPLSRSRLSQMIASELGIPKERQEWIG